MPEPGHDVAQAAQQRGASPTPLAAAVRLGESCGRPRLRRPLLEMSFIRPASARRRACPAASVRSAARAEHGKRLLDQLVENLGGALLARDEADALPGHQRAGFDIAVDHGAAQRAGPEMLDFELRVLLRQLAAVEPVDDRALHLAKPLGCRVGQRAHRDDRKARIELHRRHRVARRGADEGLLEARMGDQFVGADKTGAELHPGGAHLEIGQHRLAAADPAGDEYRHLGRGAASISCASTAVETGPIWPPASLPSMTIASAPMRTSLRAIAERRRKAEDAGAAVALIAAIAALARHAAGEHDMADAVRDADLDQLERAAGAS